MEHLIPGLSIKGFAPRHSFAIGSVRENTAEFLRNLCLDQVHVKNDVASHVVYILQKSLAPLPVERYISMRLYFKETIPANIAECVQLSASNARLEIPKTNAETWTWSKACVPCTWKSHTGVVIVCGCKNRRRDMHEKTQAHADFLTAIANELERALPAAVAAVVDGDSNASLEAPVAEDLLRHLDHNLVSLSLTPTREESSASRRTHSNSGSLAHVHASPHDNPKRERFHEAEAQPTQPVPKRRQCSADAPASSRAASANQ